MGNEKSIRTLAACVAGTVVVSGGIAAFSDETFFSAVRYFVVPAGFLLSQVTYDRTGPEAGFGTAIAIAVLIMTLAASLRHAVWPEGNSAVTYIGITGVLMGLLWGVIMPIFTPPRRDSAR